MKYHRSTRDALAYDSDGKIIENIFFSIATRGHDEDYRPTSWPKPTDARPGTVEKIEILRERVRNGQHLWHPDDMHCLPGPGDLVGGREPVSSSLVAALGWRGW